MARFPTKLPEFDPRAFTHIGNGFKSLLITLERAFVDVKLAAAPLAHEVSTNFSSPVEQTVVVISTIPQDIANFLVRSPQFIHSLRISLIEQESSGYVADLATTAGRRDRAIGANALAVVLLISTHP